MTLAVTSPGVTGASPSVTDHVGVKKEVPLTLPLRKKQKIPKRASREPSQGHLRYSFRGGKADQPKLERITVRRLDQPALFETAIRLAGLSPGLRLLIRERNEWSFEPRVLAEAVRVMGNQSTGPPRVGTG